jgi:hypothetical protein
MPCQRFRTSSIIPEILIIFKPYLDRAQGLRTKDKHGILLILQQIR